MTGCPNGCVRPYQSDIGIVGRSGDKYVLYVGGHVHGDRMNFQLKDLVPRRDIVALLARLLVYFKRDAGPTNRSETFASARVRKRCRAICAIIRSEADHPRPQVTTSATAAASMTAAVVQPSTLIDRLLTGARP